MTAIYLCIHLFSNSHVYAFYLFCHCSKLHAICLIYNEHILRVCETGQFLQLHKQPCGTTNHIVQYVQVEIPLFVTFLLPYNNTIHFPMISLLYFLTCIIRIYIKVLVVFLDLLLHYCILYLEGEMLSWSNQATITE